ncbi:hypothetical protein SLS54_003567 [Diplodia seriata]
MVNIPWKRRSKSGHHHHTSPSRSHHFHPLIPLASNPCDGADYASAVFSQRHEAAPDELCFDLFFVANLATFTAYHTVDDGASLAAYVGFFAILWATWFQVTLHDVRFARDSVYERACKVAQFAAFVGLALAGSKFEPVENAAKGTGNANLRLLCWVLVASRVQLALQYCFVAVAVARKRFSKLYLPLALNVAVYAGAAAAFGVLALAFREGAGKARPGVYWVWWVVLFVEGVGTIAISCWWRMLSFKKTHLVERMGLLTLIVIGEGAIGVTKTVSKMMGKTGVDWQGTLLVGCIVLTLVFLFLTYFDNQPHGHYGTIRQQIWALLHFPFQLAVVGVGEGSQQLALARYIINSIAKFRHKIVQYCVDDGLEGDALVDKLSAAVKYYQLDKKPECYRQVLEIKTALAGLRNATGICTTHTSPSPDWPHAYPRDFETLVTKVGSGITMSTGMKMPADAEPWAVLQHSWRVVYVYYWSALFVVFACLIAFLALIRARRQRFDLFDATSIGGRVGMLALCLFFGAVGIAARQSASASDDDYDDDPTHHHEIYRRFLASGLVLPTGTFMLGVALAVDHVARALCNWRLRRQGYEQPPLLAESPGEHHDVVDIGGGHGRPTHNRNTSSVSSSGGKMILAGEVDDIDIDEVLAKRRAVVRESRAVGFRRQKAPRPASAIYLLGNFAAGLSSVGDVDVEEQQRGDGAAAAAAPPKKTFRSFIWDTDTHLKPPAERVLLRKLDWSILTIGCLGFFLKYLDQGNLANAYVSGMQEALHMDGNEYTYAGTAYTVAYAFMQIPSTLIVQRVRPSAWLAAMEVGWGVFTFAQAGVGNVEALYAFRFLCMTVPVGLATFLLLPDTPYTTRAWFLTEAECELAVERVRKAGKAAPVKITWKTFARILSRWRWYAFVLGYVLYGSACQASNYFGIWLKSEHYSVVDRNIIPTGTNLISAACVVLWGFLSDYTGSRFAFIVGPLTYGLIPNGILAAWPASIQLKEFAFLTCGVQLMTAVFYTWANEICAGDNEERALVISSMNGMQFPSVHNLIDE